MMRKTGYNGAAIWPVCACLLLATSTVCVGVENAATWPIRLKHLLPSFPSQMEQASALGVCPAPRSSLQPILPAWFLLYVKSSCKTLNRLTVVRASRLQSQGFFGILAGETPAPQGFCKSLELNDHLACRRIPVIHARSDVAPEVLKDFHEGVSQVHNVDRLPREFTGLGNGHSGSHQFLVDDFVKAVVSGRLPPNHVWASSRYCVPGLIAHESAKHNGERLDIPDLGDPPSDWDFLDPDNG